MKLESEKLLLRPYEVDSALIYYNWFYSGKYDEYFRHCDYVFRLIDFQKYVDSSIVKIFSIFEKENGAIIGTCGLYNIHNIDRSCKLMIMIDEKYQGKGYMIEALKVLADMVLKTYHFHKVGFEVLETNKRLNDKLIEFGFKKEATIIDSCWVDNKFINENVYYMLEDDYENV